MFIILDLDDILDVKVVSNPDTGATFLFTERRDALEYAEEALAVFQVIELEEE